MATVSERTLSRQEILSEVNKIAPIGHPVSGARLERFEIHLVASILRYPELLPEILTICPVEYFTSDIASELYRFLADGNPHQLLGEHIQNWAAKLGNGQEIVERVAGLLYECREKEHIAYWDSAVKWIVEQAERRQAEAKMAEWNSYLRNGKSPQEAFNDIGAEIFEMMQGPTPEVEIHNLEDVETLPIDWCWRERIPYASLTLIEGDPGVGKTHVAMDLIARATSGRPMPPAIAEDFTYDPLKVLVIAVEDCPQRVLKPRLLAADANMSNIRILRKIRSEYIKIPTHLEEIWRVVDTLNIDWIHIEPLMAVIASDVETNSDQQVRDVLTAFCDEIQRRNMICTAVRHWNKDVRQKLVHRGGGSVGITAAARSVLAAFKDAEVPGRFILRTVKHNYSPQPFDLTYAIERHHGSTRTTWVDERDPNLAEESPEREPGQQRKGPQSDPKADAVDLWSHLRHSGAMSKNAAKESIDWGAVRLGRAIKTGMEENLIEIQDGPRGAKLLVARDISRES